MTGLGTSEVLHDYVPEALDNLMPEYHLVAVTNVAALNIEEPLDVDNESSTDTPHWLKESMDGSYADHESENVGWVWVHTVDNPEPFWGQAPNHNAESQ